MSKLFEAVDKIDSFIIEAKINYKIPIKFVKLYYGDDMIELDTEGIKAFNIIQKKESFVRVGYLVLMESDAPFNGKHLNELHRFNDLTEIVVMLDDEIANTYEVNWNTKFESIGDEASIMLFECKRLILK